jgi:hypothetical protein
MVLAVFWHSLLGCVLSGAVWAAGAGIMRLVSVDPRATLARILIPAFPASLVVTPRTFRSYRQKGNGVVRPAQGPQG